MTPTPSAREPQDWSPEKIGDENDTPALRLFDYCGKANPDEPAVLKYTVGDVLRDMRKVLREKDAAYDALAAEREAVAKDAAIVAAARRDRLVLVLASPDLLAMDVFTDRPLHVKLTANDDGTHMLTFRESDAIAAAERERDALRAVVPNAVTVRAHKTLEDQVRDFLLFMQRSHYAQAELDREVMYLTAALNQVQAARALDGEGRA